MPLEILDNNDLIAIKIQRAIVKKIYEENVLNRKLKILSTRLYDFIYNAFLTSETYASLSGGILRAEFGLDDNEVTNLPFVLTQAIDVIAEYDKEGNNVVIKLGFCKKDIDFNTVGVYISESKRGSFVIHWLYWLLTQGEIVVVPEFSIWLKPGAGRSEMAFMFQPKDGGEYSVDGQFSGTENDNWITRTLRDNKQGIIDLINKTMNNKSK